MKIANAILITFATLLGPVACVASMPPLTPHSEPVGEERLQGHMPRLQTTNVTKA